MTPAAIAADLAELARLVQHLSPDWQNPDRFYDARSELAERIRRASRALNGRPRIGAVTAAELNEARTWHAGIRSTVR
jgi:hypothetical protein